MDVNVKIRGVTETVNNIQIFRNIVDSELGMKMLEVLDDFMSDAKYFAPVDSGYLRDHITGKIIKRIRGILITGRVRSSAKYSIYQEFGTSRHPAHPFMVPAMNKNKFKILEKFGRGLDEAMLKTQYKQPLVARLI